MSVRSSESGVGAKKSIRGSFFTKKVALLSVVAAYIFLKHQDDFGRQNGPATLKPNNRVARNLTLETEEAPSQSKSSLKDLFQKQGKKEKVLEVRKEATGSGNKIPTEPEKKIPVQTGKATSQLAKGTPNKLADKVAKDPPNMHTNKTTDNNNKVEHTDILKTGSFKSRDGLELKTYKWVVDKPVGIIILVHALNCHVRFEYLKHNAIIESKEKATLIDRNNYYLYKGSWVEQFNKNGYSVYGLDMRGHGESGCVKNVKTHINNFQDLIRDVVQYANIVYDSLCEPGKKKKNKKAANGGVNTSNDGESSDNEETSQGTYPSPGNTPSSGEQTPNTVNNSRKNGVPPFYFMGLSMGGNIVLRILQLREKKGDESIKRLNIKGVISLAGMISLDDLKKKPEYKYFYIPMAKVAAALLPTMRLGPSLKFEMFPYINDLFSFDPHCYNKAITNRFGNELLKAVDALHKDMKYIPEDVQILFVHSVLDSACSYTGVSKFFNALKTKNKELFTIEDMDHILPLEPGNERILKKFIDWLVQLQSVKA
ncbi:Lysophospholipase-like protein [Plasmodium coatneyi]|uniref:Lysophospholipase-like protein n=1 Tax=Plasmodium coatneyi TaxID=208452 RepID=A0A1B1DTA3_9APIC|nr:Lysophospholipase-like protein [Plasmodium coatneyi]ANQ06036.1 Lysophospholipase-like protein [Plasmodium coatneyi]